MSDSPPNPGSSSGRFAIRRPGYISKRLLVILVVVLVILIGGSIPTLTELTDAPTEHHPSAQAAPPAESTTTSTTLSRISKAKKPAAKPIAGTPSGTQHPASQPSRQRHPQPGPNTCGLPRAAFCASFSSPSVNPPFRRVGALNSTLWGTSFVSGAPNNPFVSARLSSCGSNALVSYPANIQICNGQLVDTVNDGGGVTSLAMYPRQPFDFAGRTGTIVFTVSNDTQGSHSAWPELWVTDQPVPDPFTHEASWQSLPRNGFGVRFAGCTDRTGAGATCSIGQAGVGVDSAITVKNYVGNDSFSGGTLKVIGYGSVTKSRPGQMNHYEIRVSQSQIEVFGTDAYSGRLNLAATPLVHLATIPNVNLGFTRGLVWLEDVHYNGDKFNTERLNTFRWGNLGFDGPVLPRDLGFDVPDNSVPLGNATGIGLPGIGTAWVVHPNSSINLTVHGVAGVRAASGALLTYNFYPVGVAPITLNVRVNGHAISLAWPYPDRTVDSPRTIGIAVPLADVVTGNDTVTFSAGNYVLDVMNIDLILQGAGGTIQS
jgi:hypothetical protein